MQRFDRFIDVYNRGEADTAAKLIAVGLACQYLGIADQVLFEEADTWLALATLSGREGRYADRLVATEKAMALEPTMWPSIG